MRDDLDIKMKQKTIVVCIIENDKKELLLQKRTVDYPNYPGVWSLFGGEAESEDLHKEMNRELEEEIGMKLSLKLIFNQEIISNKNKLIMHVFLAKLNDLFKIKIGEGAGLAFFEKKELKSLKINPYDEKILNRYFKEFIK